MKKNTIIKSLTVAFLTLASVGCGSKSGTYTLSQSGNSYYSQCASVSLNLTDSSNTVQATGSNGVCTETLSGTDSGSAIVVTSFIITMTSTTYSSTMPQCTYTGTLTESGNTFSGTLTSATTSSSYYSSMCTPITIQGTKTN